MATTPNKYLRENEEMRAHIAQLKRDLEQERNAVKQAHRDKVAEVKRAREEETARYRKELETQSEKLRRDARTEKQNLERDLKQQLHFELEQKQKANEEEVNALKEKWNKEKNEILTTMKAKIHTEAMEEADKKFEVARKQIVTELFQMDTARNEAEEKAKTLTESDQEKAEELRRQAEMHRSELDKIRREAQHTDNQHMEQIKNKNSLLASKEREIIVLGEKLSRVQCERDELQDNLQRYKQGDSFSKMTPKSPSKGIGNKSFEEVTAATITPKEYTEHEKGLILKNGELSFRLKEVEKQNHMLKEAKGNLERTVEQLKDSNKPLEEKNKKLFQRCIEMQGAKQRQEMKNNQLITEIDHLKTKNTSLEKEVARQRKSLMHFLGESGSSRNTMSTLKAQNERLQCDNKELHKKILAAERRCSELQLDVERLRKLNYKFKKSAELEKTRLPASPVPPSTSPEIPHSHSDLAAVDEESHCSILQEELEQVTFDYQEMETNYGILEQEKLLLEKENDYLKQRLLGGEYDVQRENMKTQQLQHERDEALNKLQKMEDELLNIARLDESKESVKEEQKESAKQERDTHELETKLVQTEASLATAQEKVKEFSQREEQFLQQLQDMSGELEHSREQHQAEITSLREELSKWEVQNTTVEETESKVMQMKQQLQQQVQENETILQKEREVAAKEQRRLQEQQTAISAELEESHLQLQQITTTMTEKDSMLAELTDKLSQYEGQLVNVRNILREASPTLMNQGGTVMPDSITSRTMNDVIKDLVSEVDDGTLATLVSEQSQGSQAQDTTDYHEELFQEHPRQLKETISNMQLAFDQLNLENTQVKEQVTQLTQERDQLREEHSQLEQQIVHLSQERDQLKERYNQLEQQVDQISQLKGKNDQLEQQIHQLSQERDQQKESSDQELNKTSREENELEQHVNQHSQERAHLIERQNQLERQVDQLHQNRQELKERHDELKAQINQLNQEYDKLKHAFGELENLNNQLRGENNRLREQLKSHNEMTQQREAQLKEQLMEDSKVMAEMQQQLNQSQHTLNSSLHQVEERNSLLTTSQSKCQILENRLQEADSRNHTLQKQHSELQSENMKLQRELSEVSVTLKELSLSTQQKDRELSMVHLQLKQQPQSIHLSKMQNYEASNGLQKQCLFVALLDYYPQSFCKSGHPEKELQLQAGDVVNVIGDMNSDGYYHVQFNDRQGLVPAHFLEEVNIKNTTIKQRLRNQRLSNCSLGNNGDTNTDSNVSMIPYHSYVDEQSVAPPTEVRVERVLQRGLVISWTLPKITALGENNGLKIQGYQIFIDDILNSTILGCYQSKALIGSINVNIPHLVSVATFALNGTLSTKYQTHYKPIHVTNDHRNTMTATSHTHQPLHSKSPHHQNYQLMKVVHNPTPSDGHLRLQEGDIIKVFGQPRKDGNYIAEVYGEHVKIPSYLLAPVVSGV